MIAGVCAGIAEYLDTDPTVVRVIWAVLTFAGGLSILVYVLAWIIMPLDPSPSGLKQSSQGDAAVIVGGFLVLVGGIMLMRTLFPWLRVGNLTPIALITIGTLLVLNGLGKK